MWTTCPSAAASPARPAQALASLSHTEGKCMLPALLAEILLWVAGFELHAQALRYIFVICPNDNSSRKGQLLFCAVYKKGQCRSEASLPSQLPGVLFPIAKNLCYT